MTSDILKRAAEAVKGTTPGPWFTHDGDELLICAPDGDDDPWHVANAVGLCGGPDGIIDASPANARFIAAARTLIPDMAAAIAERDAEIARLTARAEAADAMADRLAEALSLARNRLQSVTVEFQTGTEQFYRIGEWADEASSAIIAMKEGR